MLIGLTTFLLALDRDEQLSDSRRRAKVDLDRRLYGVPEARRREVTAYLSGDYTAMASEAADDLRDFLVQAVLEWHEAGGRDEASEVDEIAEEELSRAVGLPYLGGGSYRCVFRLGPGLVLKLAWPFDVDRPFHQYNDDDAVSEAAFNRDMNLLEVERYEELPLRVADHVVPFVDVAADGAWLIAEEALPLPETEDARRRYGAAKNILVKHDRRYGWHLDLRPYNWGWHDERPRLIDMANATPW